MSLSPLSAIADIVAPVVLIAVATIFSNGQLTIAAALGDRALPGAPEHLGGPHGEILDEDSVLPKDRERLRQINALMPLLIGRPRQGRRAVLIIWIAIGLLVLSVAAIAVAATARLEAFAFAALALVLAGVAGVFAAIAAVIVPMARSVDALIDETRRTGVLG